MDNFIHNQEIISLKIPPKIETRSYEYISKIEYGEKNLQRIFSRKIKIFHKGIVAGKHRFQLLTLNFSEKGDQSESTSLLRKISYLFDCVVVSVDNNMRIEKVINLNKLNDRWLYIKKEISKTYKGFAVENYFNTIDNLLKSPEELIEFFHEYKMFGLFFNGFLNAFPMGRAVILEKSGIELSAKKVNNDIECIQLRTFLENEKESVEGEFYYENSCLLDATINLSKENEKHKYKLLCFGLRKNP